MTILIAGCGYVGAPLADLLHGQGHHVLGLTHSPDSAATLAATKPYRVQACDIAEAQSLAALDVQPDVIVHCASSNRGGADMYRIVYQQGMSALMQRFPTARFLFTSSTSVYPQVDGSLITETSDAAPDRETSRILRQVEDIVLASPGGTVARLAGIYGPARSFVLKNLLNGSATIEGNDGQGRALNQIHRDDAASALAHLITTQQSGIFNIVDDTPQTQRDVFITLAPLFNVALPPALPPALDRKRGWTHKFVSNAKLRSTGWAPRYPCYRDALMHDRELVPSILDQVITEHGTIPRAPNIVIVGLMGCGKSTVARIVSGMIGFKCVDTDQLICEEAKSSIPKIFETEGEAGFRIRESAALRSLLGRRGHVIATGGGIVTQPVNLPLLRQLGFVVWLDADVTTLVRRTASSRERPLLNDEDPRTKLERLLELRRPLYEGVMDQRIRTDTLSPPETSYGVSESARVWFAKMREEARS